MKRYWQMRVVNKAEKKAEILLYGLIGESFWGGDGTTAKQFVKDLKDLGDIDALDIRINSPGGLVSDGLAMYNNLKAHKAKKTVYVDGEASSIASVIAMAGDTIVMPENAWMMIHDPLTFAMGNAAELRKTADVLDKMRDGIITAYRTKTPLAEEEIKALMSAETWMLGAEAKEKGFCTECVAEMKAVALSGFDHSKFRNVPKAVLDATKEEKKNPDCMMSSADGDGMEPKKPCKECGAMDECKNPKKQTDSGVKNAQTSVPAGSGADGTTRESGPVAASAAPPAPAASSATPAAPAANTRKEIIMKKCTVCGHEHAEGVACPVCAERSRVSAIMALGKKYGMDAVAGEYVASGKTSQDFQTAVLDAMDKGAAIIPGSAAGAKAAPASGDKPFRNLGEQLQVVAIHGKALATGRTPKTDTRLLQIMDAASGASEGVDSDAGFMVQTDFAGHLNQSMMENSNLLARCFNVPVGAGANGIWLTLVKEASRATGSRWGGVRVYRVAEAEAASASKPKLDKEYMALEKMMGICYATEESLQDATSLGALINRSFGEEFGFKNDDEIVNGLGAGQMQGIMKSPALVTISKETGQAAATINADNVYKMYAAMTPRGKANGVWLVNGECWPQLFRMSMPIGTGGAPLFLPPGGITSAPYATLLGRPIIEVEQCQALGTAGDILFVDLSQYLTIGKGGLNAQSSVHVAFTTDETCFKFTLRNNGQSLWKSTVSPYKGSQARSPFVALATRS